MPVDDHEAKLTRQASDSEGDQNTDTPREAVSLGTPPRHRATWRLVVRAASGFATLEAGPGRQRR